MAKRPKEEDALPLLLFEVDLQHCLLGKQLIEAVDEAEAFEAYKAMGGINGSRYQPTITRVE